MEAVDELQNLYSLFMYLSPTGKVHPLIGEVDKDETRVYNEHQREDKVGS